MLDPSAGSVFADLREEGRELDGLMGQLAPSAWALPTPAPGWTIAHQIAHLHWTDRAALVSLTDAAGFGRLVEEALKAPDSFVDEGAREGAALAPAELLDRWRVGRSALDEALAAASPDTRFPWYGPPMKAASMASARLMETWAHGQDVADALGVRRTPTARLRHVARIGVRARDYAYSVRALPAPAEEFRVELAAPDGAGVWTYGPARARQRITGPALDFCLLVTRRAHRADLALRAVGDDADRWLDIAQAFAGPPGPGRAPTAAPTPAQAPSRGGTADRTADPAPQTPPAPHSAREAAPGAGPASQTPPAPDSVREAAPGAGPAPRTPPAPDSAPAPESAR